jgi:hypothetical protein
VRACLLLLLGCGPAVPPAQPPAVVDAGAVAAVATLDAAAVVAVDAALPPGCRRQRQAWQGRCSGVPPRPGEPDGAMVSVCDECLADGDCTAAPGGRCVGLTEHPCRGPAQQVCRYPSPECGGQICAEREIPYPPSAPPRP